MDGIGSSYDCVIPGCATRTRVYPSSAISLSKPATADLDAQARNPYSRSWLWIPGSRFARPGMSFSFLPLAEAPTPHPGEQFYPEGVLWADPSARGTLPDLLSKAAAEYGARPAIEFRDRPITYAELEAMVEVAASAFLRAGYGRNHSGA